MIIAICGESHEACGFGRVSHALSAGLAGLGAETHLIGISHRDLTLAGKDWRTALHGLDPDLVVFIGDAWTFPLLRPDLVEAAPRAAAIAYFITEYEVDPAVAQALGAADHIVVPSEWARASLQQAGNLPAEKISIVPHGIDPNLFRLDRNVAIDRAAACTTLGEFLPGDLVPRSGFLILNGNQNTDRKRLDLTIEAFADFHHQVPDSQLILLDDLAAARCDLTRTVQSAGLADAVVSLGPSRLGRRLSNQELNRLYNACDLGLNTAMGEGWGLVSWEHAATGAAQLVPDTPLMRELWGRSAVFLAAKCTALAGSFTRHGYVVDPAAATAELLRLYRDPAARKASAQACQAQVTRAPYHWSTIARLWFDVAGRVVTTSQETQPKKGMEPCSRSSISASA